MTWISRWLGFFCIWLHALCINDEGYSGDGVSKPSVKGWETYPGILPILKTLLQKFKYMYTITSTVCFTSSPPFPWTASLPMDRIPSPFCEMIRIHPLSVAGYFTISSVLMTGLVCSSRLASPMFSS